MEYVFANKSKLIALYAVAFLLALHLALPLYINSSFLNEFFPEKTLGIIYGLSSLVTLIALSEYPRLLRIFGNYKSAFFLFVVEMAALAVLGFLSNPIMVAFVFIAVQVFITLGLLNIDVYLEAYSEERTTGTLRGILLTSINIAILLGPFLASIILTDSQFERVFVFAALLLLPALVILSLFLRRFKEPSYDQKHLFLRIKEVLFARHPDDRIRHVVIANLLLRFFYSWMVIYTPIYLHQHIGFSWEQIGIILTIMLLPFVIFELLLGKLMDIYKNERGVMIIGFSIMMFFTASLYFISIPSLFWWAFMLFCTRIGASFVEIATESYFFKRIKSSDLNVLSIFRDTRPIAWLLGPIIASLILIVAPMHYLFPVLGAIMIIGIFESVRLVR